MKRKFYLLFTALLMMATTSAWAYDFVVDGIAYNKNTDGTSVTVTYKESDRPFNLKSNSYTGDIVIPATVEYDGKTYNVTATGQDAFRFSTITSVKMSEGLLKIGQASFNNCGNLTEINIPGSVTEITDDDPLGACANLKTITFGSPTVASQIKTITRLAFGSGAVTDVYFYIPEGSVPSTGGYTFSTSPTIHVYPDMASKFKSNSNWSSYTIVGDIGTNFEAVNHIQINGLYYNLLGDGTATVTYPNESVPSESNPSSYTGDITIPASVDYNDATYAVTEIGDNAFFWSKISSITFSEGLLTIGKQAFARCANITSVELPNSVTTTGGDAFAYNSKLKTFTIGSGVTKINQGLTFGYGMNTVYIKTTSVPTGAMYMFSGSPTIHVYADMVSKFKSATYWSSYNYVGDLEKDYTYDEVKAKVDEMKSLNVADYTGTNPGWYTEESAASYNKAISDFANLSENAVASEINAEMKTLIAVQNALAHNPIVEGYYYIVCDNQNIATNNKSGKALYTDETKEQLYWGELETNDLKFVFKLTNNSNETWNLQNMASGLYAGAATKFCGITSATNKAIYPATFYYDGEGSFRIKANNWTYCPQGNAAGTASGPNYVWGYNAEGMHGEASYQLRPVDETTINQLMASLLEEVVKDRDEVVGSSDPGRYTQSSADVYNAALQNAKQVLSNGSDEDKAKAYSPLLNAISSLEVNPLTEGYYFIATAGNYSSNNEEDKYALYNDGGYVKWKAYNNKSVDELYYISQGTDGWYIYNVKDNSYINKGTSSYGGQFATSKTKDNVHNFSLSTKGSGKYAIKSPSFCFAINASHTAAPTGTSGYLSIWGTVDEAKSKGKNLWYIHTVSAQDAEKLITDSITNVNPNQIVEAPGLSGTNILSNGVVENLVLTDDVSFTVSSSFTATEATYTRKGMTSKWGTIYLPYESTASEGIEYYTVDGIAEDGQTIVVAKVDGNLPANTPALVRNGKGEGNVDLVLTGKNVAVSVPSETSTSTLSAQLVGSYINNNPITEDNTYYLKSGTFHLIKEQFYIDAFHAYLKITSNIKSPSFNIVADDEPTGINTAATNATADDIEGIYSVSGMKQTDLQKGINIIRYCNGKTQKVILK